jgi:hypothetical protein
MITTVEAGFGSVRSTQLLGSRSLCVGGSSWSSGWVMTVALFDYDL